MNLFVNTAIRYIFSQGYSLYFFSQFWLLLWWFKGWGFGVGVLGNYGWGFQLMGYGACGVEPYGVFLGGGSLINLEE